MTMKLDKALDFWQFSLEGEAKRPRTVETYLLGGSQLLDFLSGQGHSLNVHEISKHDLRGFLADVMERTSPSTTKNRHKALSRLFSWLHYEGEIGANPMETIKPPQVIEKPMSMVSVDQLKGMLNMCKDDFVGRRDTAILRVLWDTGMRLSEITGLETDDINLAEEVAWIREGKGGAPRECPFTVEAKYALSRYLIRRQQHQSAELSELWLGERGPLTRRGISQMISRRSERAAVGHVHPHAFRHSFADRFLSVGGSEGDLMRLLGWADGSRSMLDRYGRAGASRRALASYRRLIG